MFSEYVEEPTTKWQDLEGFIIKLEIYKNKAKFQRRYIDVRIQIWAFKEEFVNSIEFIVNDIDTVLAAIKELREEKMWMDLLGSILTIGNLLNAGNAKKGQADGFDIKNIRSTLTIKGADGSSLLKIICLEHLAKDASFKQFLSKFEKCGQSQRIPIDSLNSRSDHIIQEANSV